MQLHLIPVGALVQVLHPQTGDTHRVWLENPHVGRPLREDVMAVSDERLFPRDCREGVSACHDGPAALPRSTLSQQSESPSWWRTARRSYFLNPAALLMKPIACRSGK
jgi:hypothetical protein